MSKADRFPKLKPQIPSLNLRGLTLFQLYHRQEQNDRNIELLKRWLDDVQDPVTYDYWVQFEKLRKKLIWAIRLKKLHNWIWRI